jgi:hypothetical protein
MERNYRVLSSIHPFISMLCYSPSRRWWHSIPQRSKHSVCTSNRLRACALTSAFGICIAFDVFDIWHLAFSLGGPGMVGICHLLMIPEVM